MKNKGPYWNEAGDAGGDGGGGTDNSLTAGQDNSGSQDTSASLTGNAGTGNQQKDWRDDHGLSDEVRNSPVINNVKDTGDALNQLYNLNKVQGVDKMPKPQDTWTDDQWNDHYSSLGRPVEAKDYKIPEIPADYSDHFNTDRFDAFKDIMHKAGIDQKSADILLDGYIQDYIGNYNDVVAQETTAQGEANRKLESDWGDSFNANLQIAQAAVKQLGGDEFVEFLKSTGMNESPHMIRFAQAAGQLLAESGAIGSGTSNMLGGAAQAKVTLEQKRLDPEWNKALFDANHPNHEQVVNENFELANASEVGNPEPLI